MHATAAAQKTLARLTRRAEFVRLNKVGRRWTAGSVVVQVAHNDTGALRVGFTATKRLDTRAVVRNRARRRLRAAAADVLPACLPPGTDIVLIARPGTLTAPYAALCDDLKWCLKRLGTAM